MGRPFSFFRRGLTETAGRSRLFIRQSREWNGMIKRGALTDPAQDVAAGDDAAQRNRLASVDCYHAAVNAWRRTHPDHTAAYAAQQAVRIVLDAKVASAGRGSVTGTRRRGRETFRERARRAPEPDHSGNGAGVTTKLWSRPDVQVVDHWESARAAKPGHRLVG
jgi:hypothetical protein